MKHSKKSKTENKNPKVIILLGPPGAGKGTQAELLAEKFNLHYLETSKIIEFHVMKAKKGEYEIVRGKKYSLIKEKKLWKGGKLNTPQVVTFWAKNEIKRLAKKNQGIIMAGSPRTLYEAKEEIPILEREYGRENIKIILISLSVEQSIWRNSHRRICELMRHPIIYTKETAKLTHCPLDGSKLMRRKGLDDPEIIKVRIKEYKERTLPLIKYLKERGFKIKKVNGEQSVADVYKDILKALHKTFT